MQQRAYSETERSARERLAGGGRSGCGQRGESLGGGERDVALREALQRVLIALRLGLHLRRVGVGAAAAAKQRAHVSRPSSAIRACSPRTAARTTSSTSSLIHRATGSSSRLSVIPRTTRWRVH